ncbi:hypothetical protein FLJC2902T_10590 [Flavobacterium limnosediminis JC2902]|uniref:Uncharacterized protein n=1 Tax=Flavobacterium limnosediminis JC2902 TaxID=1341181 RepID=V6SRD6_9FLAO|nr:hypothetical protein [Flavobacterium limnosediminis]ESU29024.1 hypothetical protein FLJC2902T_10590 [Flavobacterium limnosediminis JC2902]
MAIPVEYSEPQEKYFQKKFEVENLVVSLSQLHYFHNGTTI